MKHINIDKKELNKVFVKNFKYYLNKNDITQVELAKMLDVTPASVSNWYNGIKTPRMDKIDRLCEIFNSKRSDLLEEKNYKNEKINYELTEEEEVIISEYRKLSDTIKKEFHSFMGYLVNKNRQENTVKEATRTYNLEKKISHTKVADKSNNYNRNK